VLAECERLLELASESVRAVRAKRQEALDGLASAEERHKQATRRYASEEYGDADQERHEANRQVGMLRGYLGSDALDMEYQKSVVRQIAGLLREDALQELNEIATQSDDVELQKTITECKEDVSRAARYVITGFSAAGDLLLEEVNQARAEAHKTLERLKNLPVDPA